MSAKTAGLISLTFSNAEKNGAGELGGLNEVVGECDSSTQGVEVAGSKIRLESFVVVGPEEATHFTDLHWALKGGGNNFGVVTHYELFTIPSNGAFGGRITYPPSSVEALQKATYDYHVDTAIKDIDVYVLPTYVYDAVSNTTYGYTPVVYNRNATALPHIAE